MRLTVRQRYTLLRWTLIQLRRVARRYSINFDNAVESSRKADYIRQWGEGP